MQSNRKIWVAVGISLFVLIVLVIVLRFITTSKSGKTSLPQKNPIPASSDSYKKSVELIAPTEAVIVNKEERVGKLLNSLPYQGQYIKVSFDYKTYVFVVTLDKSKPDEAQKEFDLFLSQRGILDRSWMRSLEYK